MPSAQNSDKSLRSYHKCAAMNDTSRNCEKMNQFIKSINKMGVLMCNECNTHDESKSGS